MVLTNVVGGFLNLNLKSFTRRLAQRPRRRQSQQCVLNSSKTYPGSTTHPRPRPIRRRHTGAGRATNFSINAIGRHPVPRNSVIFRSNKLP